MRGWIYDMKMCSCPRKKALKYERGTLVQVCPSCNGCKPMRKGLPMGTTIGAVRPGVVRVGTAVPAPIRVKRTYARLK